MKVKLFIHKNHNLSVPDLAYGPDGRFYESGKFVDVKDDNGNLVYENKSATASFVEGEEIPAEYLNGDYVQKEEEINDEEITNRLSTFKAEGYRGDFASMAKLMAMGMDTLAVVSAASITTLPATNLQYNTIRDVLNANGGAVGNNMGSLFADASNVNIWSKWKPTKHETEQFTLTEAMIESANCSISIATAETPIALYNSIKDSNVGFIYLKNSFYRLGDFRNYNPMAVLPAETSFEDGGKIKAGGDYVGNEEYYKSYLNGKSVTGDSYQVGCKDIFKNKSVSYSSLRRGVLITDGSKSYWTTDYIDWTQSRFRNFIGKYVDIFEFFTNVEDTTGSHVATDKDVFFSLPYPIVNVLISTETPDGAELLFVSAIAQWAKSFTKTDVKYIITITAKGDRYRGGTITDIRAGVFTDSEGEGVGQSYLISSSETVAKGEEKELKGQLGVTDNITSGYFVVFYSMPNGTRKHFSIRVADYGSYPEIDF